MRTTPARMVNRGLLGRHRRGRRTSFGLSARTEELFHAPARRFEEPAARLAAEVLDCIGAG